MGYSEFVEWAAFAEAEPLGAARGDVQTAMVCATIANVNRKKGSKPQRVSAFIPDFWQDAARPENLMRKFRAVEMDAKRDASGNAGRSTDRQNR